MSFENPKHGDKWFCEKCHTWCVAQVPRCSWCSTPRPAPKVVPPKPTPKEDEKT